MKNFERPICENIFRSNKKYGLFAHIFVGYDILGVLIPMLPEQFQNLPFKDELFKNPSWDTFIILFFIAGGILYSFFASRKRLLVVLISIYSSLAISLNTPALLQLFSLLDQDVVVTYRVIFFLGVFILLYILLSHRLTLYSEVGHSWIQAVLLSFFQIGLLISSILLFIPQGIYQSVMADTFFTGTIPRTAWMVIPVLALFLMKRKDE